MRPLSRHEIALVEALGDLGLHTGLIYCHPTTLSNLSPTATEELRDPLEATGFVSWEALGHGEQDVRPALVLADDGENFLETEFKAYRTPTRGEKRFGIGRWRSLSPGTEAGDMVGVAHLGDGSAAIVVNLTSADLRGIEAIATLLGAEGVPVPGPSLPDSPGVPLSGAAHAYQADPAARVAVERHAVRVVAGLLADEGYELTEFGKPFDLLAIRDDEVVHVEVKGSITERIEVELTRNEVHDAREHSSAGGRILLAVVDRILLSSSPDGPVAEGGEIRLWWDLPPADHALVPTRFDYFLPEGVPRIWV